ncbi:MAG: alpha/beta hydrolase [Gammaproteobacteria bacterium]
MRIRIVAAALFTGLVLVGCGGSSRDGIGPTNTASGNNAPPAPPAAAPAFAPFFRLGPGILPFPTDLYFSGSVVRDGTLNIPASLAAVTPHHAALNALDGYSTVGPASARFTSAINAATISGATVRVVEVNIDNATKATIGVGPRGVLVFGTDYTARVQPTIDSAGATLEIIPLRPLSPSMGATNRGYLVILTNGLRSTTGTVATPDTDYATIKAALPTCASLAGTINLICQLTAAHLAIAGAVGSPAANVVLTFSFSTQATRDTLNIAAALAVPRPIVAAATGLNLSQLGLPLPPVADVYAGTLTIPYYHNPAAPLTGSWRGNAFTLDPTPGAPTSTHLTRFNPVPVSQATLTIPLFVTVPNAASGRMEPASGWPVVIFQHGLRGNRTQSAAIAATYAVQGFAVAAIDIPLHGITSAANPFFQGANERTFNLDLVNNATGAPPADGQIDLSGTHIINLTSILTSRDNLRQAAIDIVQLARSLPALDLDGDTTSDIDGTRIHYAGISLGGIVGTVANALPVATQSAYLNVPGGGVANLLRESAALSPTVNAGLAANGLVPGLTLYENFFRNSQAAIDSGDPLNYVAATFVARPTLLTQVINDTVVPNVATQRLVNAAPWVKANAAGFNGVAANGGRWVHFTSGSHGSLLDPTTSLAVTTEMQTHAASLVSSGGAAFLIANPGILEP